MTDLKSWMWADAIALLDRAEQMQRRFFEVGGVTRRASPHWEPPADVLISDQALLLIVALPGVQAERIRVSIAGNAVDVTGERSLPALSDEAHLLRLEIPYGTFERRITLPPGSFRLHSQEARDGCLYLLFHRMP